MIKKLAIPLLAASLMFPTLTNATAIDFSSPVSGQWDDSFIDFAALGDGFLGESQYESLLLTNIAGTGVDLNITAEFRTGKNAQWQAGNVFLDDDNAGLGVCRTSVSCSGEPDAALNGRERLYFTFSSSNPDFDGVDNLELYMNFRHQSNFANKNAHASYNNNSQKKFKYSDSSYYNFDGTDNISTFMVNTWYNDSKGAYVKKIALGQDSSGVFSTFGVPVPEPSSLVILSLSLFGFLIRGKRRT